VSGRGREAGPSVSAGPYAEVELPWAAAILTGISSVFLLGIGTGVALQAAAAGDLPAAYVALGFVLLGVVAVVLALDLLVNPFRHRVLGLAILAVSVAAIVLDVNGYAFVGNELYWFYFPTGSILGGVAAIFYEGADSVFPKSRKLKGSLVGSVLTVAGGLLILLLGAWAVGFVLTGPSAGLASGSPFLSAIEYLGPIFGLGIVIAGALAFVTPRARFFWGSLGIVLATLSLFTAALGGLFAGFILASIGCGFILLQRPVPMTRLSLPTG
jgi:hypothetical protein